jgi:hypothetical protein
LSPPPAWAGKYAVWGGDWMARNYAILAIPVLLCGAFGSLRGRLGLWLIYGASIDVALMLVMSLL